MFVQLNRANVSKERVREEAEKIVDFENEMYKVCIFYYLKYRFNIKIIALQVIPAKHT